MLNIVSITIKLQINCCFYCISAKIYIYILIFFFLRLRNYLLSLNLNQYNCFLRFYKIELVKIENLLLYSLRIFFEKIDYTIIIMNNFFFFSKKVSCKLRI